MFYVGKGSNGRLKSKSGRNKHWHAIVRKHGFETEIVQNQLHEDAAMELEKSLIAQYGRVNSQTGVLCNMSDGGEGPCGAILSEDTRAKISQAHKGRKCSEQAVGNMRKAQKRLAQMLTPEQKKNRVRQLRSNYPKIHPRLGKTHSEETKKRISEIKKSQDNKTWFGRKHSEETKAKISAKKKGVKNPALGRPRTEEQKKAQSERMKGRPAHNKGKPMSAQQIEKMRERRLSFQSRAEISTSLRGSKPAKGYLTDKSGRFYSQITVFGKTYHIGNFDKEEDAAASYKWCCEQLKQNGEVDISRFRKNKNQPLIIKGYL